jgi:hypothetical protein
MTLAALITIFVIFHTYVWWTYKKFGVTPSISKTTMLLKPKDKWAFTLMSWIGFAFPFIDPWLIPAGVFLVAMSATINYEKYGEMLHNVGALGCYVSAFAFLGIKFFWVGLIPLVLFLLANWYMKKKKIKNFTYWQEIVGFELIWIFLLILLVICV